MKTQNEIVLEKVIERISSKYANDIDMLVCYGSYVTKTDTALSDVDFYLIPENDLGAEAFETFILNGIGYDLYPRSWENLETIADFREPFTPLLNDALILYSRSDDCISRFNALKKKINDNLSNPEFMRGRALMVVKNANESFKNLMLAENLSEARTSAGLMLNEVCHAVAYFNQTYFKKGPKKQFEDLKTFKQLPDNFLSNCQKLIGSSSILDIQKISTELLKSIESFIKPAVKIQNIKNFIGWYEEAASVWNKIYDACDAGDADLAFISGVSLQHEIDDVSPYFGFEKVSIMDDFDPVDLKTFKAKALEAEEYFKNILAENNIPVNEYKSIDDFMARF